VATGEYSGDDFSLRIVSPHERVGWRKHFDEQVFGIAFSPDGLSLALGGRSRITVFDSANGSEKFRHDGSTIEYFLTPKFSPDGQLLVSGSGGRLGYNYTGISLVALNAVTGVSLYSLRSSQEGGAVAFSPDSRMLALGEGDGKVRVVESATGKEVFSRPTLRGLITGLEFHPTGKWISVASAQDSEIHVIEVKSGNEVSSHQQQGSINAISVNHEGSLLATASDDGAAYVLDPSTGKEVFRIPHGRRVNAVDFSPDGRYLISAGDDKNLHIVPVDSFMPQPFITSGQPLHTVKFDQSWAHLALVERGPYNSEEHDSGGRLSLFSRDGTAMSTKTDHGIIALALSSDARQIAMGSGLVREELKLRIVDREGKVILDNSDGLPLGFSPRGDRLSVANWGSRRLVLLSISSGETLWEVDTEWGIHSAAFSSDGRFLATGGEDQKTRLFDAANGAEIWRYQHESSVTSVAFAPNGKYIASCSDRQLFLFDVSTGHLAAEYEYPVPVGQVAISPDSRLMAVSLGVGASVVSIPNGQELTRFDIPALTVALRFTEDNQSLEILRHFPSNENLALETITLEPSSLMRQVCGRLTRNLTAAEWRTVAGLSEPYQRTCESLPFPADYVGARLAK
jgi:WD40 repeat protein